MARTFSSKNNLLIIKRNIQVPTYLRRGLTDKILYRGIQLSLAYCFVNSAYQLILLIKDQGK